MLIHTPTVAYPQVDPMPTNALPRALSGLHLGILDNQKPNARPLLEGVVGGLRERDKVAGATFAQKPPNLATSEEELARLAQANVQLVVVASADCGSCTSWCIHDAIALERRGKPAIVLVTTAFLALARKEATAYGMPELRIVEIPHPLGGASAVEVGRYAQQAVAGIEQLFAVRAAA